MAKKVEKTPTWGEIGELLMKIMINILSSAIGIWIAVNLFFVAFAIPLHLTIVQAISIFVLTVMLSNVFGIGGSSK